MAPKPQESWFMGSKEAEMTSEKPALNKSSWLVHPSQDEQKAVDDISSAQVTEGWRRRVSKFCFRNSEPRKNAECLGESRAPSPSQHLPLEWGKPAQHVVQAPSKGPREQSRPRGVGEGSSTASQTGPG